LASLFRNLVQVSYISTKGTRNWGGGNGGPRTRKPGRRIQLRKKYASLSRGPGEEFHSKEKRHIWGEKKGERAEIQGLLKIRPSSQKFGKKGEIDLKMEGPTRGRL